MNEPSNFGTNEEKPWNWPPNWKPWSLHCNVSEEPPFRTGAAYRHSSKRLSDKTICLEAKMGDHKHYDVHNLYGRKQSEVTYEYFNGKPKRGWIISRSSFPGSGKYGGKWSGDNSADWSHLRRSIVSMLDFNLFGIPFIGDDICGYFGNTTEELCTRWMQLGAFYPFTRNHNGKDFIRQDPAGFNETIQESMRSAMNLRYSLLPYLYTLFDHAHTDGHTVARSVDHEFSKSAQNRINEEGQTDLFMWGSALLICPALDMKPTLTCKLPNGVWFLLTPNLKDTYESKEGVIKSNVTLESIPQIFLREGYIIPYHNCFDAFTCNNTIQSRSKEMNFFVALDTNGTANGDLYWDDDGKEYLRAEISFHNNNLTYNVTEPMLLDIEVKKLILFRGNYTACDGGSKMNKIGEALEIDLPPRKLLNTTFSLNFT